MNNSKRYATVTVSPLNGGSGQVWRNVDKAEFCHLWMRLGYGNIPTSGVGATGNGILNFSWKIYDNETPAAAPIYGRPLSSRLYAYKFHRWSKVADEVLPAARGEKPVSTLSRPAREWMATHRAECLNLQEGRGFDW